jgi:adenosylhomocysteinase
MARNAATLKPDVYDIPADMDREIARLKLAAMGVKIDLLTGEQSKYLNSWEEGT